MRVRCATGIASLFLITFGIMTGASLFVTAASAQAEFHLLPLPAGADRSDGYAVSADGSTVVGRYRVSGQFEPCRWPTPGTVEILRSFGTADAQVHSVSADGDLTVGGTSTTCDSEPASEAYQWTPLGQWAALGHADFCNSYAYFVSDDGSVIAGAANFTGDFQWYYSPAARVNGGSWEIVQDTGGYGVMNWVLGGSPDGEYLVGGVLDPNETLDAFVTHRVTDSVEAIQDLPGGTPFIYALDSNSDGDMVVGQATSTFSEAFLWTPADSTVGLGDFDSPGENSKAWAIHPDGSLIVGFGTSGGLRAAAIWESDLQIQNLAAWLTSRGVVIPAGVTLYVARDIRQVGDRVYICGTAIDQGVRKAFLAKAPWQVFTATPTHVTPGIWLALPVPNPSSSDFTRFDFSVSENAPAGLSIYDARGRLVVELPMNQNAGSVVWDNRNSANKLVATGTYYAVLRSGGQSVTQKVVVLR